MEKLNKKNFEVKSLTWDGLHYIVKVKMPEGYEFTGAIGDEIFVRKLRQ